MDCFENVQVISSEITPETFVCETKKGITYNKNFIISGCNFKNN